jgi:acetyl-CoA carboxylase carboxyltransferase component
MTQTVNLSLNEVIAILDPLNANAYDKLQQALEKKAIALVGEDSWLNAWNSDEWAVSLNLEFNVNKSFDVRWGAGYAHPDNKTVYMSEITEENGWDIYNIEKIEALRIGQGVDCSDIGGEVFVTRIK